MDCKLSGQCPGRDRGAARLDRRPSGRLLPAVRRSPGLHLHGQVAEFRRRGQALRRIRRMAAGEGAAQGRARRPHDAQRAAISRRHDGHIARRLHGRERQPALHAARTRTPAQGFRRRSDRHPGEFRQDAAGRSRQDPGQACRCRQHGRDARRQGTARQLRGEAGQEARAELVAARPHVLQRRAQGRRVPRAQAGQGVGRRHRLPAIHRRHDGRLQGRDALASQRAGQRHSAEHAGSRRPIRSSASRPTRSISARCRSITSSR